VPLFEQIDHAGLTDVGIRRTHNQDAFSVRVAVDHDHWLKEGHIFLVADGMGGHAVGEKASAKAVREIPLTYAKHVQEGTMAALRRAFQETNAGIHAVGKSNPEFRGLGTTATGLVLRDEGAWVAHVGDSRVYRVREGNIEQLTFDHSYAWEMARRLNIAPEDLPEIRKNVIIRSLGPDPLVQVDIEGPYPLQTGDVFILCSDGLSNHVAPDEIGTVAAALQPNEAVRFLIELANLRGGTDNITILIVRVGAGEPSVVAPPPRRSKALRVLMRFGKSWNQRVPWPLTVLGFGLLLAVCYILTVANDGRGGAFLFTLALLSIIAGIVGLVLHARQEKVAPPQEPERPRKLMIYRQFECRIEPGLVDKLSKMGAHLKEQMETNGEWNVDWNHYRALHESAERSLKEGDLLTSFRDQCRALMNLAHPYNQSRQKDENFQPKFQTPIE
jgi:PPM family protein phosphatase